MTRFALTFSVALLLSACRTKDAFDSGVDTGLFWDCEEPVEGNTPVNSTCTYTPPPGSFDFSTEWSMTTFADFPTHKKSYSSPMVGQFTDDTLDGLVDEWDVPLHGILTNENFYPAQDSVRSTRSRSTSKP